MGRFARLSIPDFVALVEQFPWPRKIDAVHMHHTWQPNHGQWRGEASVESMWEYHTKEKHWADIAQHLTIAPDGGLWTGRDWRMPPASAVGYNGNAQSGPFMFETVGNFDLGADRLEGAQREAVIEVIARLQERHRLPVETLRFHCMMSTKTCPGTSVDYETVCGEVSRRRTDISGQAAAPADRGWAHRSAQRGAATIVDLLSAWQGTRVDGLDGFGDELPENDMPPEAVSRLAGTRGFTARAPMRDGRTLDERGLSPEALADLRPHVVNLNEGAFSSVGLFRTAQGDVDAIFDDSLERAARQSSADKPLRILFWAHGGLVDEASGLGIAHKQIKWWLANGVYPIHFVWETGFADALKQILVGTRDATRAVARDVYDHTTDPVIEATARALGGGKIWSAMKRSAELASALDGGARYVAQKLGGFCRKHPHVRLYAAGHSAGSIFHAHFLPAAFDVGGVPPFEALYLLAPAIRSDTFKDQLLGHVPSHVRKVVMWTMQRDWEEADSVWVYKKSLLYLIRYALEPERLAPILGLDECLRADPELASLFGLQGKTSEFGEVVWSVTDSTTGPRASTSRSHGGFDDDPPTMNAIAERTVPDRTLTGFSESADSRTFSLWTPSPTTADSPPRDQPAAAPDHGTSPGAAPTIVVLSGGGRYALCVGIDEYEGANALHGCVADAVLWQRTLESIGFAVTPRHNGNATRAGMLDGLRELLSGRRPGDVLVFQYSGHGTEVEDLDGDETEGTNGAKDEALCPIDSIRSGAFLIDDEMADLFASSLADGINLTCFMDCCHSGTITRFLVGPAPPGGGDRRPRFLRMTPEIEERHRAFRRELGRTRGAAGRGAPNRTSEGMRQVVFSACRDYEVAYEENGQGDFTRRAAPLLSASIGMGHDAFLARVLAEFGTAARQHPELDCSNASRTLGLFQPLTTRAAGTGRAWGGNPGAGVSSGDRAMTARVLRAVAAALED
jgi:hypothetical protein